MCPKNVNPDETSGSIPGHVSPYPKMLTQAGQVECVPRRIRGVLGGETVFDTTNARYVWEGPYYPQYYVPVADVRAGVLVPAGDIEDTPWGKVESQGLRVGELVRHKSARLLGESSVVGLSGTVRFEWSALDGWFEEDERIFVHPRSPYVRVDALRSTRRTRVELDGVTLADSGSTVMVFETGLPTRHYFNRTEIDFAHLIPSDTVTSCPYKGTTGGYWSARTSKGIHRDLAWCYDFPTREVLPIAGLVAFYDERVDTFVDGELVERPRTHFR